jgi:hypothetical protein
MQWILRAWRGEEKLWKVFWIYLVLAGQVLTVLTIFGVLALLPHVNIFPWHAPLWVYALCGAWGMFLFCVGVWSVVALWRCTFNTDRRFWGYAARVAFFCSLAVELASYFGGFSEERIEAETGGIDCQKMMHDYAVTHGLEPQKYIEQNQIYMQDCMKWPHFFTVTVTSGTNPHP